MNTTKTSAETLHDITLAILAEHQKSGASIDAVASRHLNGLRDEFFKTICKNRKLKVGRTGSNTGVGSRYHNAVHQFVVRYVAMMAI